MGRSERELQQDLEACGDASFTLKEASCEGDRAMLRLATSRLARARQEAAIRAEGVTTASTLRGSFGAGWTLLDQFVTDGKRFVVLSASEPVVEESRPLTAREREILSHAAMDKTNKQIAYELGVTAATVRVLLARGAQKLGARRRSEAIEKFRAQQAVKTNRDS